MSGSLKLAQYFPRWDHSDISKTEPVKRATDMECGDLSPLFKCNSQPQPSVSRTDVSFTLLIPAIIAGLFAGTRRPRPQHHEAGIRSVVEV